MSRALLLVALALPALAQVGGGYTAAGLRGEYYASPDLSGQPAFVRQDVRLDFDWGERLQVGGSTAEPYRSFPRDNFSVRWTGRLLPRFSEPYIFTLTADDGARLRLAGRTLVDGWDRSGALTSQPVPLTAGRPIDLVVEYRELSGPAVCRLSWRSPSTPGEVIDPVSRNALNATSWFNYTWADLTKTCRWNGAYDNEGKKIAGPATDEFGWPQSDCEVILGEGTQSLSGRYRLQLKGQAKLTFNLVQAKYRDGDEFKPAPVPAGFGYDPATNTTTVDLDLQTGASIFYLRLQETRRTAASPLNSGFTDLRVMRPLSHRAERAHALDAVVYEPFKAACAPYVCLRWLQIANQRYSGRWADRTPPTYFTFTRGGQYSDNSGGECWERLVQLANETGKDLYLTLPMLADDEYFDKIARLLKYGSDGREPYDTVLANPVYPPLNPNLKLYFEVGNEIWNWAFGSTQDCNNRAREEIAQNTPDGRIINYDGQGNYRRYHALRTVRASDTFRRIFGDAAMGHRIRALLEYQYNNAQETAWQSFRFLDGYFNNGTGQHVAEPRSVSYYLWGAGGATYYGTGNKTGEQTELRLADHSFDDVAVGEGQRVQAPTGGAWSFSGNAGVYRNASALLRAETFGERVNQKKNTAVGLRFQVERPIWVHQLGRWLEPSVDGAFGWLLRAADLSLVARAAIPRCVGPAERPGYRYGQLDQPVQLAAGVEYLLVTAEAGNGGRTHAAAPVTAEAGVTITGAATVGFTGAPAEAAGWKIEQLDAGAVAVGPVNLRFTTGPEPTSTEFCDPAVGSQAAWLRGEGELAQTFDFPRAGHFALAFRAAGSGQGWPGHGRFKIMIDETSASPVGQTDHRVSDGVANLGGFHRQLTHLREVWGSAVFEIDRPGPRRIRFVGEPRSQDWVVFDEIELRSVEAIMTSGFGAGEALGQVAQNNHANQLNAQAAYARTFGLEVVAYEAGWSLGGDFLAAPIQTWCKFVDPRAEGINTTAMDIFTASSGTQNVWGVYHYWPADDVDGALGYPLMRSLVKLADRLPAEDANGAPLPATLTPADIIRWKWSDNGFKGELAEPGAWASWLIVAPRAGEYRVTLTATGDGQASLEVDGRRLAAPGVTTATVWLTKGTHGVRVRCETGRVALQQVTVTPAG